MAALQLGRAVGGVGRAGHNVAVAASHRCCVGDGVEARCPSQHPQVGAAGGLGSQVGRRTWSCQKIRCVHFRHLRFYCCFSKGAECVWH